MCPRTDAGPSKSPEKLSLEPGLQLLFLQVLWGHLHPETSSMSTSKAVIWQESMHPGKGLGADRGHASVHSHGPPLQVPGVRQRSTLSDAWLSSIRHRPWAGSGSIPTLPQG